MLRNEGVHTENLTVNRPGTIIKNKKEKTCILMDVAILADGNVMQREAEKKVKYKTVCGDAPNVERDV